MSRANATPFESSSSVTSKPHLAIAPLINRSTDARVAPAPTAVGAAPASARTFPASQTLTFAVASTESTLASLERDWDDLFARAGKGTQVFQTFSWNWHWCRHFIWNQHNANERAVVVTARLAGRLVMVWPLTLLHTGPLRELAWMGEPVSQYGDILADLEAVGQADIAAAWAFTMKELRPDVVRLRRVRADAVIAPHLATLSSLQTVVAEAPHLDLTSAADFAAYEQRYSSKARKNRRRLARRLEEQGTVKYDQMAAQPAAAEAARQAVEMKQSWLRDRGLLSPALADPRFATFMSDVASVTTRTAGMTVNVLSLNNKAVGIQIGVIAKKRLSLHVIVYDLAYEKSGVGVLHLEHAIAQAYEQGLEGIDLLAPKAEYKMDWADGTVAVIDHAVPVSAAGKVYAHVYLGFVREHAKSLVQRLPTRLAQRLMKR
jgi:CelD/BcsL family acetyltransferase involved in cellulose biosynthesis